MNKLSGHGGTCLGRAPTREWYRGLTPAGKAAMDRIVTRLESLGNQLRMPHSRPLGDGLYELRFTCENVARRITYVFEPRRRAVTLTTFRKQKQNERGEVLRARRAQAARAEEIRRADDVGKANKKKGRANS